MLTYVVLECFLVDVVLFCCFMLYHYVVGFEFN